VIGPAGQCRLQRRVDVEGCGRLAARASRPVQRLVVVELEPSRRAVGEIHVVEVENLEAELGIADAAGGVDEVVRRAQLATRGVANPRLEASWIARCVVASTIGGLAELRARLQRANV